MSTYLLLPSYSAKKQIAQLTVVDYIVGISIGNIAGQWATDTEKIANDLIKLDIKKASPSSYLIIDGNIVNTSLINLGKKRRMVIKEMKYF